MKLTFEEQLRRTMSIIKELSHGKHLTLPSGSKIGMAEDMTIGFLHGHDLHGESMGVSGLATLDIRQFNDILNKNDILFTIPDMVVMDDVTIIDDFEIIED